MTDQPSAQISWTQDNVPVSDQFDDPYYSLANGVAETEHVFLAGNNLPDRFCDGFHIAELGFGTGLNFLTALRAFRAAGLKGTLHFTSFEAFPMDRETQLRALAAFPDLPVDGLDDPEDAKLTVVLGDARQTLPRWSGKADAWFLDGFSPAKNPELWDADLMHAVAQHTNQGGTAATYTAAGFVRRGLSDAGFEVERVPGFGRKRHMTRAILPK